MSRSTATLCKFVGTISLGLLTGSSYTILTTALPPILSLPTAQPASTTFQHLLALTKRQHLLLSTLSSTSLLLAYTISSPRSRHPYLLWATLAIAAGYAKEIYVGAKNMVFGNHGKGKEEVRGGSESGDEEWEVEGGRGGLNGEVLREGMERWRGRLVGSGVVWGVGWVVSVVGLWGDGV